MKYSIEKLANNDEEDFAGSEQEILERSLSKSSNKSNGSIRGTDNSDGKNVEGSQTSRIGNGSTDDTSFIVDHDPIMSFDQLEQMAKYIAKKLSANKQGKWTSF